MRARLSTPAADLPRAASLAVATRESPIRRRATRTTMTVTATGGEPGREEEEAAAASGGFGATEFGGTARASSS